MTPALVSPIDWTQLGALHVKAGAAAESTYALTGRLYASASGWLLLSVPNNVVRGLFDALQEPGVELPPGSKGGPFNAHVSVMRKEEVLEAGGPDKITERGHFFSYQLGPVKTVVPMGWDEMSRVWFVEIRSPDLQNLRKSYGLPALPQKNGEELPFHLTIAVRRKKVLQENEVSKAATHVRIDASNAAGESLQHHYLDAGEWSSPAGRIEEGETPLQAALRELKERTGYEGQAEHLTDAGKDGDFQVFKAPLEQLKQTGDPQTETRLHKLASLFGPITQRAVAETPIRYDMQDGVGQNMLNHLGAVSARGQRIYDQGQTQKRMTADLDPKARLHQFMGTLEGKPPANNTDKFFGLTTESPFAKLASAIDELIKAKAFSDRKQYDRKTAILRRLMKQSPTDFMVDDPTGKYHGITHKPTNFRLHMPATAIPPGVSANR